MFLGFLLGITGTVVAIIFNKEAVIAWLERH